MAMSPEQQLLLDALELHERTADERFMADLYSALANNRWRRDGMKGELSVSWSRAEEVVNELRRGFGHEPLDLAQRGGEGEISTTVAEELGRLGWRAQPLDTSTHDPGHVTQPEASPPPRGQGERFAPADQVDWEREAHEATDEHSPVQPREGTEL